MSFSKKMLIKFKIYLCRLKNQMMSVFFICRYRKLKNAFTIKSHLTISERVKLFKLACGKDTIVEIGSYIGASACCFGASTQPVSENRKIICIDTWQNDAMSEGHRDTWSEFNHNTRDHSQQIHPIRGYSTSVIKQVIQNVNSIDLLFIDGDHSYDGVKADWEEYKFLLREGATVVFHDYGWAEGVQRVIREDVMPIVNDYQSLPNMWWGTVGKLS